MRTLWLPFTMVTLLAGSRSLSKPRAATVRTPNGNDYGKDLLRQHYQKFPH